MLRVLFCIWIAFVGVLTQAHGVCPDCSDHHAAMENHAPVCSMHAEDAVSSDGHRPCNCECHRFSGRREAAFENAGWSPLRYLPDARSSALAASGVRANQESVDAQIGLRKSETRGRLIPRLNALLCTWLV